MSFPTKDGAAELAGSSLEEDTERCFKFKPRGTMWAPAKDGELQTATPLAYSRCLRAGMKLVTLIFRTDIGTMLNVRLDLDAVTTSVYALLVHVAADRPPLITLEALASSLRVSIDDNK